MRNMHVKCSKYKCGIQRCELSIHAQICFAKFKISYLQHNNYAFYTFTNKYGTLRLRFCGDSLQEFVVFSVAWKRHDRLRMRVMQVAGAWRLATMDVGGYTYSFHEGPRHPVSVANPHLSVHSYYCTNT